MLVVQLKRYEKRAKGAASSKQMKTMCLMETTEKCEKSKYFSSLTGDLVSCCTREKRLANEQPTESAKQPIELKCEVSREKKKKLKLS